MPISFSAAALALGARVIDVAMRRSEEEQPATFTSASLDNDRLAPAPIRPEWILEGNPEARCEWLSGGTRGGADMAHWSCTAGRFRWEFAWDESVLFLEGEVFVTNDRGNACHGKPGVSMFFPAGTTAVWDVPRYIRKIAFNRRPTPYPLHVVDRAASRIARIAGVK